jgi:hypothetical protein
MRIALTFVVVAAVSVALPAAAEEAEPASPASGTGAAVAPSNAHTLAQVHGGLTSDGARAAGRSRDIEMSATKGTAAKAVRPAPTPRVLRRMAPERAVPGIDLAARACASDNPAAAPTTLGLRISVAPGGEVEGAELASTNRVAPALLTCVIKAVSAARFGAPGPAGASIVLPITVPGRSAVAAAPADTTSVTITAPVAAAVEAKPEEAVAPKP